MGGTLGEGSSHADFLAAGYIGAESATKTAEGRQVAEGGNNAEGGNLSKMGYQKLSIGVFCVEFHEEVLGRGPET